MKFTRVAAFFVAFIGLIAVVAASPAVKRQDLLSTVLSLVLGLVNTVLSLLGELLEKIIIISNLFNIMRRWSRWSYYYDKPYAHRWADLICA